MFHVLEFTCWNEEVVRVTSALDCHDRESIGRVAITCGISGETICAPMVACVKARFAARRAPFRLHWLADHGSVYAAAKTIDRAIALNFEPCFTPVESPESSGVAEAFVLAERALDAEMDRHLDGEDGFGKGRNG